MQNSLSSTCTQSVGSGGDKGGKLIRSKKDLVGKAGPRKKKLVADERALGPTIRVFF